MKYGYRIFITFELFKLLAIIMFCLPTSDYVRCISCLFSNWWNLIPRILCGCGRFYRGTKTRDNIDNGEANCVSEWTVIEHIEQSKYIASLLSAVFHSWSCAGLSLFRFTACPINICGIFPKNVDLFLYLCRNVRCSRNDSG